jgi:hypothetical protein
VRVAEALEASGFDGMLVALVSTELVTGVATVWLTFELDAPDTAAALVPGWDGREDARAAR